MLIAEIQVSSKDAKDLKAKLQLAKGQEDHERVHMGAYYQSLDDADKALIDFLEAIKTAREVCEHTFKEELKAVGSRGYSEALEF